MHQNASFFRIEGMEKMSPPDTLRSNILTAIRREELRRAKIYLAASLTTAAVSLAGLVLSFTYLMKALAQSGFSTYFSLLFSDLDVVMAHWQELALSLVEVSPFLEMLAVLGTAIVLLVSVRVFAYNLRTHLLTPFSINHQSI